MATASPIRSSQPSGLGELLDKGMVIDAFVRVSLVGIEILTIDARIVIASVDTYLRFAEAVNRLDLESSEHRPARLPEFVSGMQHGGGHQIASKARGALRGVKEAGSDLIDTVRRVKSHDDQEEGD